MKKMMKGAKMKDEGRKMKEEVTYRRNNQG